MMHAACLGELGLVLLSPPPKYTCDCLDLIALVLFPFVTHHLFQDKSCVVFCLLHNKILFQLSGDDKELCSSATRETMKVPHILLGLAFYFIKFIMWYSRNSVVVGHKTRGRFSRVPTKDIYHKKFTWHQLKKQNRERFKFLWKWKQCDTSRFCVIVKQRTRKNAEEYCKNVKIEKKLHCGGKRQPFKNWNCERHCTHVSDMEFCPLVSAVSKSVGNFHILQHSCPHVSHLVSQFIHIHCQITNILFQSVQLCNVFANKGGSHVFLNENGTKGLEESVVFSHLYHSWIFPRTHFVFCKCIFPQVVL